MSRVSISINKDFWKNADENVHDVTIDKYGHVHFTAKKRIKKEDEKHVRK